MTNATAIVTVYLNTHLHNNRTIDSVRPQIVRQRPTIMEHATITKGF